MWDKRETVSIWHEPLGLMSLADFLNLTFMGTCQWILGIFPENGRSGKHIKY